jgi:hypothetical protein
MMHWINQIVTFETTLKAAETAGYAANSTTSLCNNRVYLRRECSKFQSPNHKLQTNPNLQIQMTKKLLFEISNFGHWNLFVIWCLRFDN